MKTSVQMYTVRDALAEDYQGTVARLVELGLEIAEPFHLVEQQAELVRARAEQPIAFPSAHQSFLGTHDLGPVLEAARAVGVQYLIDPYWDPETWTDAGKVRALADRLNGLAEQAAGSGVRLGYHNHHFEVASQLEGCSALELFAAELSDEVVLEVDTYWAVVGGADISALLGALGERVRLVHLKDGDLAADPAGQLPLGTGRMPLEDTIAAAVGAEIGVTEFDEYAGDMLEGIGASLAYLRDRS